MSVCWPPGQLGGSSDTAGLLTSRTCVLITTPHDLTTNTSGIPVDISDVLYLCGWSPWKTLPPAARRPELPGLQAHRTWDSYHFIHMIHIRNRVTRDSCSNKSLLIPIPTIPIRTRHSQLQFKPNHQSYTGFTFTPQSHTIQIHATHTPHIVHISLNTTLTTQSFSGHVTLPALSVTPFVADRVVLFSPSKDFLNEAMALVTACVLPEAGHSLDLW